MRWILLLFVVCSSACVPQLEQMSVAEVDLLSHEHGYIHRIIAVENFSLLTVSSEVPPVSHGKVLRVYIEGDGLAWRTRRHLAAHPTPVNPLALRLMLVDPSPDKLYIARPCQFVQTDFCHPRFWSTDRYHADVIAAVAEVLMRHKQAHGYAQVELVGYSGGASVALLLASVYGEVLSVLSVRTVSGNLDPTEFCKLHHVTPLSGSLNPVDFPDALQSIPQLHFVGSKDTVVPVDIFYSYLKHFSESQLIKLEVVPDVGHHNGWVDQWLRLVQQPLPY